MDELFSKKDLKIDVNGNLVISNNGDLEIVQGGEAVSQEVMVRLRTYFDESPLFPNIGTNLSDFAGQPNTREVGLRIEQEIINSLTRDGFLRVENIYVAIVPVSETKLLLIVDPDKTSENSESTLEFDIDLMSGSIS